MIFYHSVTADQSLQIGTDFTTDIIINCLAMSSEVPQPGA